MTCKDCIHCGICHCDIWINKDGLQMQESKYVEHNCPNYKDKNRFIELPIKAGDTAYFVNERQICDCDCYGDICQDCKTAKKEYYITKKKMVSAREILHYGENEFGKTIFLTQKEAEEKIKKMEEME